MKRFAWLVLCGFLLIIFEGCVVRPSVAPPLPKVEVRGVSPGLHYVWVQGYWKWSGGMYVWVSGHWIKAHPGRIWAPGHWEQRGHRWVWKPGHWRRG